jgi:hypothetical protein
MKRISPHHSSISAQTLPAEGDGSWPSAPKGRHLFDGFHGNKVGGSGLVERETGGDGHEISFFDNSKFQGLGSGRMSAMTQFISSLIAS